jgi:hypothetical protein
MGPINVSAVAMQVQKRADSRGLGKKDLQHANLDSGPEPIVLQLLPQAAILFYVLCTHTVANEIAPGPFLFEGIYIFFLLIFRSTPIVNTLAFTLALNTAYDCKIPPHEQSRPPDLDRPKQ